MARETIYENPNVMFSGGEGMVTNLLLIPNTTYQIVWDGDEHTSTAAEVPFNGMTVVAIGDLGMALGAPTGEYPFLIGALPDGSVGYAFSVEYETPSHSIAVYRDAETPVTGETIVLKDRDGNKNYYNPPNGVRFEMGDGNQQLFVSAADLPKSVSVTVDPDFTGNKNMTVVPENGTQFSEVIVKKPENLISKYIKDGINIAGITGEFQGSGGNVKVAWGILPKPASFTSNPKFTHNLGVVPDFILVETIARPGYANQTATSYPHNIVAFSKALGGALGTTNYQRYITKSSSGNYPARTHRTADFPITWPALNTPGIICMANETSFSTVGLNTESNYFWIAVGGLT